MNSSIQYIKKHLSKMGSKLVYQVLLLTYAYNQPNTPNWAKSTVIGAMSYLLSPIDSIPDLTPFIGFTDDMGVVMFALVAIACYINSDVREKAKKRVQQLIPSTNIEDLLEVDKTL